MTEMFSNTLYTLMGADWVSTNGTGSTAGAETDVQGRAGNYSGDSYAGAVFIIGTDQRLWRSGDAGYTWSRLSTLRAR